MKLTEKTGYYTCTNCNQCQQRAWTVVLGSAQVLVLCRGCLGRFGKAATRRAAAAEH